MSKIWETEMNFFDFSHRHQPVAESHMKRFDLIKKGNRFLFYFVIKKLKIELSDYHRIFQYG